MKNAENRRRLEERLPVGVVVADASGRVQLINTPARRIFGVASGTGAAGDAGGAAWKELLENLRLSARQGLPRTAQLPVFRDAQRVYRVRILPLADGSSAAVAILEEVTAQAAFLEARGKFLADTAHRLHSPLSAIGGAASLLLRGRVAESPEERGKVLEIIREEYENLSRIIVDMLPLVRLDEGLLGFRWGTVDLDRELRAAVGEAEQECAERGLSLRYRPAGRPSLIRGNRRLIREMVRGLLSVAGADGGGEVTIRLHGFPEKEASGREDAERAGSETAEVRVEIGVEKAGGEGALPGQAEEPPPGRRERLLMCRAVAEVHNGRLQTEERHAGKRTFTVFFPGG